MEWVQLVWLTSGRAKEQCSNRSAFSRRNPTDGVRSREQPGRSSKETGQDGDGLEEQEAPAILHADAWLEKGIKDGLEEEFHGAEHDGDGRCQDERRHGGYQKLARSAECSTARPRGTSVRCLQPAGALEAGRLLVGRWKGGGRRAAGEGVPGWRVPG